MKKYKVHSSCSVFEVYEVTFIPQKGERMIIQMSEQKIYNTHNKSIVQFFFYYMRSFKMLYMNIYKTTID